MEDRPEAATEEGGGGGTSARTTSARSPAAMQVACSVKVNTLLDNGSTQMYVNTKVAAELSIQAEKRSITVSTHNGQTMTINTMPVHLQRENCDGTFHSELHSTTADRVASPATCRWLTGLCTVPMAPSSEHLVLLLGKHMHINQPLMPAWHRPSRAPHLAWRNSRWWANCSTKIGAGMDMYQSIYTYHAHTRTRVLCLPVHPIIVWPTSPYCPITTSTHHTQSCEAGSTVTPLLALVFSTPSNQPFHQCLILSTCTCIKQQWNTHI